MIALIDGDIVVYRCAWASDKVEEAIARWRTEEMINTIVADLEASDFKIYLTSQDRSNFRFEVDPQYKANRVAPKPRHYLALRTYMIEQLGAVVVEGEEADDALGKEQINDSIICTIDKDLDQIPGWHYNFVKKTKYNISPLEAQRHFYWQMLVGDKAVDNVEGCPGIGESKATRLLDGCQDEIEMCEVVVNKYLNAYGERSIEKLLLAGKLLWIRKRGAESWQVNGEAVSKPVLERFLRVKESSLSMNQKNINISCPSENEST